MNRKTPLVLLAVLMVLASLSCTNPITRYFSTQTAVMETATATMWTPTPTNTPTFTPTFTPTNTPTSTLTPTPDNRYYEKNGPINYSYVPPTGWRKSKMESGIYAWNGKGDTELDFYLIQNDMDATSAATKAETALKSELTAYTVIDEGLFSPDSGIDAYRFTFTADYAGSSYFFDCYLFSQDGYILEGLYGRTNSLYSDQDNLVTDSMMTVKFD
jgi:ABC-type cobalt transport system substrate-binding protein